jgi:hypothetical protein
MSNPFVSDPSLGLLSALGISGSAQILTPSGVVTPGFIATVSITVAGSAAGSINDSSTVGGASASNAIMALPNTIGVILIRWPCSSGIVVTPGTGQTVSVSYSK